MHVQVDVYWNNQTNNPKLIQKSKSEKRQKSRVKFVKSEEAKSKTVEAKSNCLETTRGLLGQGLAVSVCVYVCVQYAILIKK